MVGESECANLPEELAIEILSRLPAKSLMRFKSVCKAWNSIINSSSFISKHSLMDHPPFLFISSDHHRDILTAGTRFLPHHTLSIGIDNGSIRNFSPTTPGIQNFSLTSTSTRRQGLGHDDDHLAVNTWFDISCYSCCNGFVFLNNVSDPDPTMWNPATGETELIPITLIDDDSDYDDEYEPPLQDFGIGFDSKSDEYKPFVIRNSPWRWRTDVLIYSYKTNRWKTIQSSGITSHHDAGVVYTNGMSHWIGFSSIVNRNVVVSFDMSNEMILTTPFADDIVNSYRTTWRYDPYNCPCPLLLNESFALVVSRRNNDGDDPNWFVRTTTTRFDIWVLLEYGNKDSWSKIFTIGPLQGIEKLVGFWNETKIFVSDVVKTDDCGGQLFLYDTVTQQMLNLQIIVGPFSRLLICPQSLLPIVDPSWNRDLSTYYTKLKKRRRYPSRTRRRPRLRSFSIV